MISHTHIGVSDFGEAFSFYRRVMDALGMELKFNEPDAAWAGWRRPGTERPLFLIGKPFDGGPRDPGNGNMVALLAPSREAVDASYAAALDAGGTDEGAPGLRPHYHEHYYGAYFRDPDGNKICVCRHAPVAASE